MRRAWASGSGGSEEDARLWLVSASLALVAALVILVAFGWVGLSPLVQWKSVPAEEAPPELHATAVVVIVPTAEKPRAAMAAPVRKPFARTPAAVPVNQPERAAFQGEKSTIAASEAAPVPDAPPLPSQTGATRKNEETDLETTKFHDAATSPAVPEPAPEQRPPLTAATAAPPPAARPAETLLAGPNPVDVPVPPTKAETTPQPRVPPIEEIAQPVDPPKPAKQEESAIRPEQRKTALVGSISRGKQSALDVEDTPLGRYQAAVSRAVEQEWQRNCVRHRNFIVPGFLTARFTVAVDGKVKSVDFEGEMEGGQVQKGFTLDAIRKAELPAMPAALRKEHAKRPLELVFRFFF